MHSQLLRLQINPLLRTPLSINYLHSHLHLSSFQRSLLLQTLLLNLHLHLHVLCHSMRLVSLFPDTRLNTLTFKFLTTPGTHNFARGLLILLQLPLHLLVLILQGSPPLTLTTCGLVSHFWLLLNLRLLKSIKTLVL